MTEYTYLHQQLIIKALHEYLLINQIKEIYIYSLDTTHHFLNDAISSLLYIQQYQDTTIYNPSFYHKEDFYLNSHFDKITDLIIFDQKDSDTTNIYYYVDIFNNKPTFFYYL